MSSFSSSSFFPLEILRFGFWIGGMKGMEMKFSKKNTTKLRDVFETNGGGILEKFFLGYDGNSVFLFS